MLKISLYFHDFSFELLAVRLFNKELRCNSIVQKFLKNICRSYLHHLRLNLHFRNSMVVNICITFACMQSYRNFLIHLLRQFEQCECMCEFSGNILN